MNCLMRFVLVDWNWFDLKRLFQKKDFFDQAKVKLNHGLEAKFTKRRASEDFDEDTHENKKLKNFSQESMA
jgi:hypothetical protein